MSTHGWGPVGLGWPFSVAVGCSSYPELKHRGWSDVDGPSDAACACLSFRSCARARAGVHPQARMCVRVHACLRACAHVCVRTCMRTCVHACARVYMHVCAWHAAAHAQACVDAYLPRELVHARLCVRQTEEEESTHMHELKSFATVSGESPFVGFELTVESPSFRCSPATLFCAKPSPKPPSCQSSLPCYHARLVCPANMPV